MSEAKHTPGPWVVEGYEIDIRDLAALPPVGLVRSSPRRTWVALTVTDAAGEIPRDANERDANTRLIAAAPDMLAALRHIASSLDIESYHANGSMENRLGNLARAAIAKATGLDPGTASVAHVDETGGSQESKP